MKGGVFDPQKWAPDYSKPLDEFQKPVYPYTQYKKEQAAKKAAEEARRQRVQAHAAMKQELHKLQSLRGPEPGPAKKASMAGPGLRPSGKPKSPNTRVDYQKDEQDEIAKLLNLEDSPAGLPLPTHSSGGRTGGGGSPSPAPMTPKEKRNLAKAAALWDALGEAQTKLSIMLQRSVELKSWAKTVCDGAALKSAKEHHFHARAKDLVAKVNRVIAKCAVEDFKSATEVHHCLKPVDDLFEEFRRMDKDYRAYVVKRCDVPTSAHDWQDVKEKYRTLTDEKRCKGSTAPVALKEWVTQTDPDIYGRALVCMPDDHKLLPGQYFKGSGGATPKVFLVQDDWVAVGFPSAKLKKQDKIKKEWEASKESMKTATSTFQWLLALFKKAVLLTARLVSAPLVWLGGKIWKFYSGLEGWKSWIFIVALATGTYFAGPMLVALGLDTFAWVIEGFGLICSYLPGHLYWYAVALLALISYGLHKKFGNKAGTWSNAFIYPLSAACYLGTFCTWFTRIFRFFHTVVKPKVLSQASVLDLFAPRSDLPAVDAEGKTSYLSLNEVNEVYGKLSSDDAFTAMKNANVRIQVFEKDGETLPVLGILQGDNKADGLKLKYVLQAEHPPSIGSAFTLQLNEMNPSSGSTSGASGFGVPKGEAPPGMDDYPSFANFANYFGSGAPKAWQTLGQTILTNLRDQSPLSAVNLSYAFNFITLGLIIVLAVQGKWKYLYLLLAVEGLLFGYRWLNAVITTVEGSYLETFMSWTGNSRIYDFMKGLRDIVRLPVTKLEDALVALFSVVGVTDAAGTVASLFSTLAAMPRPDIVTAYGIGKLTKLAATRAYKMVRRSSRKSRKSPRSPRKAKSPRKAQTHERKKKPKTKSPHKRKTYL